jgi:hypothetical protein
MDRGGWGTQENIAAFYKFRACKGLSEMKGLLDDMDDTFKKVGFTPAKVNEILNTPADKLVEELSSRAKK